MIWGSEEFLARKPEEESRKEEVIVDSIKIKRLPSGEIHFEDSEVSSHKVQGEDTKNILKDRIKTFKRILKLGNKKTVQLKTDLKRHFTQRRDGEGR